MTTPVNRSALSAKGLAHLSVVYVVWGSTYLAIRLAVREGAGFPPFALGAIRVLIAGGLLVAWGAWRRMRLRLTRAEFITLAIAGLLMWPSANGLVNWAEQRADSSYAALLVGALPIWAALIEAILDRKRPSWRLLVSLLVGFVGLGLLTAPKLAVAGGADVLTIIMLLIAPIPWAVGSILQLRRPVGTSPLISAAYLHLFGGVGFVALSLLTREPQPSPSPAAWGALAYLTVAGSIGAFTSYVQTLRLLPLSVAMTYAYVNPAIAVVLGWILLHEPITPPILGGMALILGGVYGVFREKYAQK
ncbi:EamA family transporter [Candidatus Bipolaricaulota bacterium]